MQKFGEKSVYIGCFMAILGGGHIVHIVPPPRTQATSRRPAPLGLKKLGFETSTHTPFMTMSSYFTFF